MDSAQTLYTNLRKFNGLEVHMDIGNISTNATFVRAEQIGSEYQDQIKLVLQNPTFTFADYTQLKRSLGNTVKVRIGNIQADLILSNMTIIPMSEQSFKDEIQHPFEITFGVEKSDMSNVNLVEDLRAAGYHEIASRVINIQTITGGTAHQKMIKAVQMLKSRKKYALAEKVDQLRISAFGVIVPEEDRYNLMVKLLQRLISEYIPDVAVKADVLNNLALTVKDRLDDVKHHENEVDALGPGEEPQYVQTHTTLAIDPLAPSIQKVS